MSSPVTPKIPTPDQVLEVTNRQISQSMDLINSQMAEISATLGLPALPLPKLAPPTLPKLGVPGGFPAFPTPFGAPTPTRAGEGVTRAPAPTPARTMVLA